MAVNSENSFRVCRTCLKPITSQSLYYSLDAGFHMLQKKLVSCVPELNLALTSNAVLCDSCVDAINSSMKFKRLCYQTEVTILKYLQQTGPNITVLDLVPIAKVNRNNSTVVDIHVKEEIVEIKQESESDYMAVDTSYRESTVKDNGIVQNINSQRASTGDTYFPTESKVQLRHGNNSRSKSGKEKGTLKKRYYPRSIGETYVYKCHKCVYRSTYKLQFATHIRSHLTKSGYQRSQSNCRYIKISSNFHKSMSTLSNKTESHTVEKICRCSDCGYITKCSRDFMCHMMMHAVGKPYNCS